MYVASYVASEPFRSYLFAYKNLIGGKLVTKTKKTPIFVLVDFVYLALYCKCTSNFKEALKR